MSDMIRLHALVRGRVQGVSFRAATREVAKRLLLSGWVKNLADGRVELEAVGTRPAVEELRRWLDRGPPGARVDEVVEDWTDAATDGATPLPGFHVIH